MKLLATTLALSGVVSVPLASQTTARLAFDSVVKHQMSGSACYAGARYVVVERNLQHQVGADLIVRSRGALDAEPRCSVDSSAGDIVFRSGDLVAGHPDAQHFLGLKHHMLLAWDGTGARSDLYVYDLNKRAKVLEVDGFDDYQIRWVDDMMVEMWVERAYDKRAVAAGCPDTVPGNPAELDSLMRLDLAALTLRPTSRFRCIVGQ